LNDLKLLIERITDGGGQLSVVLAGHPKLHNDLKNLAIGRLKHDFSSKFDSLARGSRL
jgi:type II secretory pathway predicted ATPase ExeA